jgi:F-type H+-transporting ATPase subunit delta
MTELATLARPYAVAVFKRAKQTDGMAKWSEALALINAVVTNKDMQNVVNNPKLDRGRLANLVLSICEGQLDAESANFLKLLLENNRLVLLPEIAKIYEELKADEEGYVDVQVITAYAFTKEAEKEFTNALEKSLNKKIHMNATVDKSLIGGVLVRAGDKVIDGSIRSQLQHLQKALQ